MGAAVLDDARSERLMLLTQDRHYIFRVCTLRKASEAPQIAEESGNLSKVDAATILSLCIVALIGAAYAYYWYSPAPHISAAIQRSNIGLAERERSYLAHVPDAFGLLRTLSADDVAIDQDRAW
jgi:hypothetical protein